MTTQYFCQNDQRRKRVAEIKTGEAFRLNGLDYLEVDPDDQKKLSIYFVNPLSEVAGFSPLSADNITISGGARIVGIRALDPLAHAARRIDVTVDQAGDFSAYTLRIVSGKTSNDPPAWLDPMLSEIEFCFKINCPSDFDCRPTDQTTPLALNEPAIDYRARDYESFRRLLLERMSQVMPEWKERNPADMGVALAELLAYVGDHLSYRQDAVATEAYLGTARRRVSLARHARLLDYPVCDGASGRAWVQIAVTRAGDGLKINGPDDAAKRPGVALLTRLDPKAQTLSLTEAQLADALSNGAQVFETLHSLALYQAHNEMHFYDWANEGCRLPKGATQAFLQDNRDGDRLRLCPGDVLIFEEKRSPDTGLEADANPARRHAVRLTTVYPEAQVSAEGERIPGALITDPLFPTRAVVEIRWHDDDALPFDLCVHAVADPNQPGVENPVCVASGNIILADHGLSVREAIDVTGEKRFRPALAFSPLARQGRVRLPGTPGRIEAFDPEQSAAAAMRWPANRIRPAIALFEKDTNLVWQPQSDLLSSDAFAREFVVETEEDGRSRLRFGDGVGGQKPDEGQVFEASYRIGGGVAGNVGAQSISALLIRRDATYPPGFDKGQIRSVRNPMAAQGGINPETAEQIRQYAPQAFKIQERAVTAQDYADIAMRHPEISKAAATVRWTGSWHTVFVTLDRKGGKAVDAAFIAQMKTFLDGYRMAGYDIEISAPRFVSLDIACEVCVKPGYDPWDVKKALLEVFSSSDCENGRRGFFHPDRFTFGQSLNLSSLYAEAMAVEGIMMAKISKFQRLGRKAAGELAAGAVKAARLEILRLDNDPNYPENGKIEFIMRE